MSNLTELSHLNKSKQGVFEPTLVYVPMANAAKEQPNLKTNNATKFDEQTNLAPCSTLILTTDDSYRFTDYDARSVTVTIRST